MNIDKIPGLTQNTINKNKVNNLNLKLNNK